MSRINWFEFERQLLSQFAAVVPEQRPHGLGQQYLEEMIKKAVQLAKNLHRGSPTGAVGSHGIWARSMDDLRTQMLEREYGELFPEEEEICIRAFAREANNSLKPMVLVWHYKPDDIEFEVVSGYLRSRGGGGGCGTASSSSGGGSSGGGWH